MRSGQRQTCHRDGCFSVPGITPGPEAQCRNGRSVLLRACGLWDLRTPSRSFTLVAGFGFHWRLAAQPATSA